MTQPPCEADNDEGPTPLDEIRALEEALHRPEIRQSRSAVEDLHARFCDRFAPVERVNFLYHRANRHIGDGNLMTARDMLTDALSLRPGNPALKHRLRDLDARIAREEKLANAS